MKQVPQPTAARAPSVDFGGILNSPLAPDLRITLADYRSDEGFRASTKIVFRLAGSTAIRQEDRPISMQLGKDLASFIQTVGRNQTPIHRMQLSDAHTRWNLGKHR